MATVTTDLLLLRCRVAHGDGLPAAARQFCERGAGLQLQRLAWSAASGWAYLCARPEGGPRALAAAEPVSLARLWQALCPEAVEADVSRLQCVLDLAGHSHDALAQRHYVVETDPEAGWDEELARWYAQEHMPGLAAVPGCIRARRFLNHDAGPRSLAHYDLVDEQTLGSPPWLAVRNTDWSSRVRPHFTNTRRTMMAVLG